MRVFKQACLMCVLLTCAVALLTLPSLRRLPAQPGAGGGTASRSGDVNCDGELNIGDPILLLNFLFLGGKEPCATAQTGGDCCPEIGSKLDRVLAVLEDPCRDPVTRFTNNGDRTVTDHCTGLQWLAFSVSADVDLDNIPDSRFNYHQARNVASQERTGGHTDWRLPTARELEGLMRSIADSPFRAGTLPEFEGSFSFGFQNIYYWSATDELPLPEGGGEPHVYVAYFNPERPSIFPYPRTEKQAAILVRGPVE